MKKKIFFVRIFVVFLTMLFAGSPYSFGQGAGNTTAEEKFSQEELDQMLAPIALYPDSLLAQMLMAATYPLEVVAADRWVKENPNLKNDALDAALKEKDWDVSVKSLAHFPQVLAMMDEKIEWTTRVGDAFLAQQDEVMDTIQGLRAKAEAAGNLRSTREQRVVNEQGGIEIEPGDAGEIYVPEYDPLLIYGPWWYPAFPPFAFYYPGVVFDGFFGFAFGFGAGFGFGWCSCDWHHHGIYIDYDRCGHFAGFDHDRFHGRGNWEHDPGHRRGVAYRDQATSHRFGVSNQGQTTSHRFSVQGLHSSVFSGTGYGKGGGFPSGGGSGYPQGKGGSQGGGSGYSPEGGGDSQGGGSGYSPEGGSGSQVGGSGYSPGGGGGSWGGKGRGR